MLFRSYFLWRICSSSLYSSSPLLSNLSPLAFLLNTRVYDNNNVLDRKPDLIKPSRGNYVRYHGDVPIVLCEVSFITVTSWYMLIPSLN